MALPVIATPKYTTVVPSTGEKIEFRPYLVKEEKILMMAMESQDEKQIVRALVDTIEACTDNKIKVSKLPIFDLEYIFMQLRSKSVGETSQVRVKCEECKEPNDITINLAGVQAPTVDKKKTVVKLTDNISVQLKYPTVKDSQNIEGDTQTDQVFNAVAATIETIYYNEETLRAEDHSKQELMDFIESLSSSQFQQLAEFVGHMPSLQTEVDYTCEKCGHKNHIMLKGLANFF